MSKTKDVGIVILPDDKCKMLADKILEEALDFLPNHKPAKNNPHITLYHISNVKSEQMEDLKSTFNVFGYKYSFLPIKFPVLESGFKATGGTLEEGYKWLDLQFKVLPNLDNLREGTLKTFSHYHNGILERMKDDEVKFTEQQKSQLKDFGVTVYPYLPHVTACYIDLPSESKTSILQKVAESLKSNYSFKNEYNEFEGKYIALVELGRNGNAFEILDQIPLVGSGANIID